jgi:hypothetical protein
MKQNQKLRVIVSGVHFYSTPKAIRNGVGDQYTVNAAVQKCLLVLETMRKNDNIPPVGLAGTWEGRQVQLDMV